MEKQENSFKPKIGIFGGSFNPVHIGHLALANYLCEYGDLDEVWFMVTPQNPLKPQKALLNDEKRLMLVELAIREYEKFRVSDFEFHLPRPSYTVDTLRALRTTYSGYDFILLIGADNWALFNQWKDSRKLLAENQVRIYPRPGCTVNEKELPPGVQLIKAPLLEVSSSFIRESIRKGKEIRYFLHPAVYRKIKEEGLYL